MNPTEVQHILCAVLGKPTSRQTVTKAIDLALEHNARLTFVHVLNADFMASATPVMTSLQVVYNQLRDLGEFSMLILCDRAQRRGLDNVSYIIREGQVLPQLRQVISELRPDMFVVGRPIMRDQPVDATARGEIDEFLSEVEEQSQVSVVAIEIENSKENQ